MGNIHTVGPNEALIVSGMFYICLQFAFALIIFACKVLNWQGFWYIAKKCAHFGGNDLVNSLSFSDPHIINLN